MPSSCSSRVLKGVDSRGVAPQCLLLRQIAAELELEEEKDEKPELTVEEAIKIAVRIREEAEGHAVSIRERARQEGFDSGYAEGHAKAEEVGRRIVAGAQEMLHGAEAERAEILGQLEREIVDLAQDIARRIVAAELEVNPEVVLSIAREALVLVRDRPYVLLMVHPDDLAVCSKSRQQFEMLLLEGALRILPDPQVERGGCMVDTGQGMVDASIVSRWITMIEGLKG